MNLIIGSHVSFTQDKQMLGSVIEALKYGANTFMFYTGAPQNTNRKDIDNKLTELAHNLMLSENININDVIVHAPYIINLANSKNYDFNVNFLKQEIKRVEQLGVTKLVLHPGSHVGLGVDKGIENIINSLNECVNEDTNVIICLETMAGKGSEIGKIFEEIRQIIDGINFVIEIANATMPLINEKEEILNKEGIEEKVQILSEALQEHDNAKTAQALEEGILPFVDIFYQVASILLAGEKA